MYTGATVAKSPADIAAQTKNIITMLPSHPHVKEVYTNKTSGILAYEVFLHLFVVVD